MPINYTGRIPSINEAMSSLTANDKDYYSVYLTIGYYNCEQDCNNTIAIMRHSDWEEGIFNSRTIFHPSDFPTGKRDFVLFRNYWHARAFMLRLAAMGK